MLRSFSRPLLGLLSAAFLLATSPMPVMSLSLEDTQKKLEVIAVFTLISEKGEFYQIVQGDTLVIPLFLQAAAADQMLKSQGAPKGQIQAFSLNLFLKKADELRSAAEKSGKKLATPIVVPEDDMAKAKEILRSEGLSSEAITKGLRTPIFFAEPMIAIDTPSGNRSIFFADYGQLQRSIARLPDDKRAQVKEKVADLDVVLEFIRKSETDQYSFMPTEDYAKLRNEYLKTSGDSSTKK